MKKVSPVHTSDTYIFHLNNVKTAIFALCDLFYFSQPALKSGQMPYVDAIAEAPQDVCNNKGYHWLLQHFMDNTVITFSAFGSKLHENLCCCAIPHSFGRALDVAMRSSQSCSI